MPGEWERRGRCTGPLVDVADAEVDTFTGRPIDPLRVSGGRVAPGCGRSMQETTYQTCPVGLARAPWVDRVADLAAMLEHGGTGERLSAVGWDAVRWWRVLVSERTAAEVREMRAAQDRLREVPTGRGGR